MAIPRHREVRWRIGLTLGFIACWGPTINCAADDGPTTIERIRERGVLRWGADQEGGAPYCFPDPRNPARVIGFEVEIAEEIAREFKVRTAFVQGQWQQLPLMLERRSVDVVMNGFERTPERLRHYQCSRPYYASSIQLMARRDGAVRGWEDLVAPAVGPAPRVGILPGSQAEAYVRRHCPGAVAVGYDSDSNAMSHVEHRVLDASVADDCVAIHYLDRFPELTLVGRPVGAGYFIILMNRADAPLREAVDRVLDAMLADGRLRRIYDRWDMSGRYQELSLRDPGTMAPANKADWRTLLGDNFWVLTQSAGMTVLLAVVSMPIAVLIGLGVAIGRRDGPPALRALLTAYIEILRGTPLMLQLYVIFFMLPELGIAVPALVAAISGLAINYSASEAEIIRAGLQSVPIGQSEAALALGMSRWQTIRRILLPQALRLVIPPMTSDFIAMFKDTSVCSVVTVVELTKRYNVLAQSTGQVAEMAAITALLYLAMSYPLARLARYSERRLHGS